MALCVIDTFFGSKNFLARLPVFSDEIQISTGQATSPVSSCVGGAFPIRLS